MRLVTLFFFLNILLCTNAYCNIIKKINIEGNERIDDATIISYLNLEKNNNVDIADLNIMFKELFSSELFSEIIFNLNGDTLIVKVKENPIINRIALEGNKRVKDDDILPEILIKPRDILTLNKVKNNLQKILGIYRGNGRYAAVVSPKVIYLEQNRVDLVFEIEEGPLTKIGFIKFLGNNFYSDSKLKTEILTKESKWWKVLSAGGKFDPDLLNFDQENLKRYYANKGFVDASIETSIAELNLKRDAFFITFIINEGERYKFGDISADVKLRGVDKNLIRDGIRFKKGSWFSSKRLDDAIVKITENIMKNGIPFISVQPSLIRKEDNSIDVVFNVIPAKKNYINKIIISGNTRTLDKVIRRKLRIAEGDAYNSVLIKRSRLIINNMGHFSKVEFSEQDSNENLNSVDININVEETATGEFSLGGGFSSGNGAQATVGLSENNLFGKGQRLRLHFLTSERQNRADFSFTEPFFLNRDVSLKTDIFTTVKEYRESFYDNETEGIGLGLGYNIGEYGRQSINYSLENRSIIAYSGASASVKSEEGDNVLSIISLNHKVDRTNSRLDPTDGWYTSNQIGLAGIGGDKRYLKLGASVASFRKILDERFIFSLIGKSGYILGIDQNIEISDRYVLGDNTFVGFKNAGVGPRDVVTDQALGGNIYYTLTPEIKFDLGLPKELGIRGRIFAMAGSLSSIDTNTTNYYDNSSIRLTTGAGVLWQSPFGPIRIDYSHAILKEDYDKTETFSFNIGQLF